MSAFTSYNVSPNPNDSTQSSGVPIGSISLWGASSPPSGYLVCDGAAVSRSVYSDLFSVIGTNFGAGDGAQLPVTSGSGTGFYYTLIMPANNNLIAVGDSFTFAGTGNGFFDDIPFVAVAPTGTSVISFESAFTGNVPNAASAVVYRLSPATTFNIPDLRNKVVRGPDEVSVFLAGTGGSDTTTFTVTADNLPQHRHGVFVPGGTTLASGSGLRAGTANVDDGTKTITGSTQSDANVLSTNAPITTSVINSFLALYYIIHYG